MPVFLGDPNYSEELTLFAGECLFLAGFFAVALIHCCNRFFKDTLSDANVSAF
jgi:hypothetical protein